MIDLRTAPIGSRWLRADNHVGTLMGTDALHGDPVYFFKMDSGPCNNDSPTSAYDKKWNGHHVVWANGDVYRAGSLSKERFVSEVYAECPY